MWAGSTASRGSRVFSSSKRPGIRSGRNGSDFREKSFPRTSPDANPDSSGNTWLIRRATETKAAFKTTELMAYVAAVVAVLIAGMVLDQSDGGGLGARQGWL